MRAHPSLTTQHQANNTRMPKFTQEQKIYRLIQKQFNKATKDYAMFDDGDKILVALSGGKDSLTLLELMSERSRIFKPSIKVPWLLMASSFSRPY